MATEGVTDNEWFVWCGEAYYSEEKDMRAPQRGGHFPSDRLIDFGFRLVCGAAPGACQRVNRRSRRLKPSG